MKLLLAPFFLAFFLNLFISAPTYRTFGLYTDHLSHMMTVFLFVEHGLEVYRKDVKDLCKIRESSEITAFNEQWSIPREDQINTCQVNPGGRVLFVNWPHMARPYPLGEIFWYAPAAGMYVLTGSLPGIAQFLIWQFLLLAGVGMVIFLNSRFFAEQDRRYEKTVWALIAAIALSTTAVMGFYDGLAFWLVSAAILYAINVRGVEGVKRAALLFSFACFFHYRAIWYFPIFLFALNQWWRLDAHFWRKKTFALIVALIAVSAFTLLTCVPSIQRLNRENPFLIAPDFVGAYLAPLVCLCVFLLWRERNLTGVFTFLSCLAFSAATPLAQRWYILFWIPLLLIALRKGRGHQAFWGIVIFLFVLDQKIYDLSLFAGGALPMMFHGFLVRVLN